MCEFGENDRLISLAFPFLFLLGNPFKTTGSIPKSLSSYFLNFHDHRFEEDSWFRFLLFNQLQRHEATRAVAAKVSADPEQSRKFVEYVNKDDFRERLQKAIENTEGKEAKEILSNLLPLIKVSGSSIPYGPTEKTSATSKLYAMVHALGPPTWFVTVSPSDMDSVLLIRHTGHGDYEGFSIPDLNTRRKIASENPTASAKFFMTLLDSLFTNLYKCPVSKHARSTPDSFKKGALGKMVAHFGSIETQGRGALHYHAVVWTTLTPKLLETAADKNEFIEHIRSVIDSIVRAQIPLDVHEQAKNDKENGKPATRFGLECPPLPREDESDEEYFKRYNDFVHKVARTLQNHVHTETCKKYSAGTRNCRLAMPQPLNKMATGPVELEPSSNPPRPKLEISYPETRLLSIFGRMEDRLLLWILQRPNEEDQRIVDFSPLLTAALRCNTAIYLTGAIEQSKSVSFYVLKYVVKNPVELTNTLSCAMEALNIIQKFPSLADDSGDTARTAKHLLTRILNNLAGSIEVSGAMASAALLGLPSTFASHDFWYCWIRPAVTFLKKSISSASVDVNSQDTFSDSEWEQLIESSQTEVQHVNGEESLENVENDDNVFQGGKDAQKKDTENIPEFPIDMQRIDREDFGMEGLDDSTDDTGCAAVFTVR